MKPMLFNADMVRAILDGRKAVTRRLIKDMDIINGWDCEEDGAPIAFVDQATGDSFPPTMPCPYQSGDILYVRETWTKLWYVDPDGYTHYDQPMYYYAADGTPDITLVDDDGFVLDCQRIRWHPSIHMPREAARIFLRVTDVRVERLHDITNDDLVRDFGFCPDAIKAVGRDALARPFWDTTIKPADRALYGWEANPWVRVIEFERVSKEEAAHHGH